MNSSETGKPLLRALKGKITDVPPIWLMRQAGRYLPEYRQTRQRAGNFLNLVYSPELACEVTMQPLRRYDFDAAIIFSDILVIPQALGQELEFIEEKGPVLNPVRSAEAFARLSPAKFAETLAPVYEALRLTCAQMRKDGFGRTTMIGFSGAPWTLACYMVEGGSSRDFQHVKSWAYRDPESFSVLIDTLTEAVTEHLLQQIAAGAEVVQIFDSWSGVLDHNQFSQWVIKPTRRIAEAIREAYPDVPVIGFPKGCGRLAMDYAQNSKVTALSLDSQISPKSAVSLFQPLMPVQGNLDPVCLLAGGTALEAGVEDIVAHLGKGPFIFNLGHGIVKETPPENVEKLVALVRGST